MSAESAVYPDTATVWLYGVWIYTCSVLLQAGIRCNTESWPPLSTLRQLVVSFRLSVTLPGGEAELLLSAVLCGDGGEAVHDALL